ncbi:CRISPR-associated protein Cas2 [Thermodesulfovibrio aggregans]|uniref:CRISPR-associated endoribonuclease Cas2 n=1 Tax=Thermodesulfovibrio aggregans TaxID=86166 RepID=A0A0U9HR90_9BACT|nr:CRISPR-associated endonuclease Cas2 [Thermodesulfovibrio aggregans]GAQ95559.1 CRISPR-associated protein Cas2 [Thermodesulfovibrio aggregans]
MRTLFIIAYDITDERRLAQIRYFLKGYSTGGQRSVYECYLTKEELKFIISKLKRMIFPYEDRVHIFRVDGRSRVITLGIAVPPSDPSYFYIG